MMMIMIASSPQKAHRSAKCYKYNIFLALIFGNLQVPLNVFLFITWNPGSELQHRSCTPVYYIYERYLLFRVQ